MEKRGSTILSKKLYKLTIGGEQHSGQLTSQFPGLPSPPSIELLFQFLIFQCLLNL